MTKVCPYCYKKVLMEDVDGYLIRCPECNMIINEDEHKIKHV